jgi:rhodanese-related sulfurtransferase
LTERVTANEANLQWRRGAQVVDVRSAGEFRSGHVAGASNIPLEELESRLDDLDWNGPVLLVCQAGLRAEIAAGCLAARGIRGVVLQGGTDAWRKADLDMVASSAMSWSLERQVRLAAGVLVIAGVTLALTTTLLWVYLAGFVGAGLTMAGLTGFCPMAKLLAVLPWNRSRGSSDLAPAIAPERTASCRRDGAVEE